MTHPTWYRVRGYHSGTNTVATLARARSLARLVDRVRIAADRWRAAGWALVSAEDRAAGFYLPIEAAELDELAESGAAASEDVDRLRPFAAP